MARDAEPLFREFEHTGDLGIEVIAPTRAELFRRATLALARLMVEAHGIDARESRDVVAHAATDADLMHDLLATLLNLFIADGFIWCDARVKASAGSIAATVVGESFDAARHTLSTEIKAVTYSGLEVKRISRGWRARIIFDV